MLNHFLVHFQDCPLEKVQSVKRFLVGVIISLVLHFKLQLLEVVLVEVQGRRCGRTAHDNGRSEHFPVLESGFNMRWVLGHR